MVEKAMASTSRIDSAADIAERSGPTAAGAARVALAAGGLLAALGATSCCVIPFTLFMLGVSGAWIGNLTAIEPYKPIFVSVTVGFLGYGFYLVYRKPKVACAEGSYCAKPSSGRTAKIGLWTATVLVVVAIAFPQLAPLFL